MKSKKAFTLIELLVVIAIIGILATVSIISLSNARAKSRDAKRAGDMKQVQTALELFFNDKNRYPTVDEWNTGQLYSTSSSGTSTYMQIIPVAPTPNDGNCTTDQNAINYIPTSDGSSYSISFCLGGATGTLDPGLKCLTPGGIVDVDCSGACSASTICGDTCSYNGDDYPTVDINGQCWFRENLKTTRYNDGAGILNLTDNSAWETNTTGAYAWYNNDYDNYGAIYGALYNFYAVDYDSNGGKNLCPAGWHVPTDAELKILVEGQGTPGCESTGWHCSPAGDKLKEIGAIHWDSSNTGATNSSGFTALGAGIRGTTGSFLFQGTLARFWSEDVVVFRALDPSSSAVARTLSIEAGGHSIRCLQD